MRAVGYIRVSTDDQAREGVSLDNQRAKIEAYAALKDLHLVETIEDSGISAKNLRRPGVQRVLAMVDHHQVEAIIVYKLDRMFRSTTDALQVTKQFDKCGVAFHSIQEAFDTRSAMGRFFFTLVAALSEMERDIISERTTSTLKFKRSRGEKTGGDVPYGFTCTNGILFKDENEQKAIRLMLYYQDKGYSLRKIAIELQKEGYLTRRGHAQWQAQSINQILHRVRKAA